MANAYFLKCVKSVEVGPLVVQTVNGATQEIAPGRTVHAVGDRSTVRTKTDAGRMVRSGHWVYDEPTMRAE